MNQYLTLFPAGSQNYVNLRGGADSAPPQRSRKLMNRFRRNKRQSTYLDEIYPLTSKKVKFCQNFGSRGAKKPKFWHFFSCWYGHSNRSIFKKQTLKGAEYIHLLYIGLIFFKSKNHRRIQGLQMGGNQ